MYINMAAAIEALTSENTNLVEGIETCETHKTTLQSISFESKSLSGQAMDEIKANLAKRPQLLQVRISAYEAIRTANTTNITHLTTLKDELGTDVADMDLYDQEINTADSDYSYYQEQISELAVEVYTSDPLTALTNASSLAVLTAAKESAEARGNLYREKKCSVEHYIEDITGCYTKAKEYVDAVLTKSTESINTFIATGVYDTSTWQDAFNFGIVDDWQAQLDMAAPYLTPKEYEALKAAYEPDGVIAATDIYDPTKADCKFNDSLYGGLAKLPSYLLPDEVVGACADAYTSMWSGGDMASVERLIEVSYLPPEIYTPGVNCSANPNSGYTPILFNQSPLLLRVSDSLSAKMPGASKEDSDYYKRLAGTTLLDSVVTEVPSVWADGLLGVDVHLEVYESYVDEGTAVLAAAYFNTKGFDTELVKKTTDADTTVPAQPLVLTFSGDMHAAYAMLSEAEKITAANDLLAISQENYEKAAADMVNGSSEYAVVESLAAAAKNNPALSLTLGFAVDSFEFYSNYVDAKADVDRAKINANIITNFDNDSISRNANDPIISGLGYSMSIGADGVVAPDGYNYKAKICVPEDASGVIGSEIAEYNESTGGCYSQDTFINDLLTDPYNSTIPTKSGGNATAAFIEWTNPNG